MAADAPGNAAPEDLYGSLAGAAAASAVEPLKLSHPTEGNGAVEKAKELKQEEEEEEEEGEDEQEEVAEAPEAVPPVCESKKKWPGWPGDSVFRMIVPVVKVGSIIGRKGVLVKRTCEETRARIRVLEGPVGTSDRIVLISGREEPEAEVSPAMDAAIRVFKRVNGLLDGEDGELSAPASDAVCSVRFLVASSQAFSLIGKGGVRINSIQDGSGATIRVLSGEDVPFNATSDERIIDIQGHPLNVLKVLEKVLGHLRKFLVDHSVLSLFEKTSSSITMSGTQDRASDAWSEWGSSHPSKLDAFSHDQGATDPWVQHSGLSMRGHDSGAGGAFSPQITRTIQIPLVFAEDIIGVAGKNIAYIRQRSGSVITFQEGRGVPDEMLIEIKGTNQQVQVAQQLIHEFTGYQREPMAGGYEGGGGYRGSLTSDLGSYSQMSSPYPSSASQSYGGGYGSSDSGHGYGRYRY